MSEHPKSAHVRIAVSTDGGVRIEVDDPSSRSRALTIKLTADQFMSRIGGVASHEHVEVEWGRIDMLGWGRVADGVFARSHAHADAIVEKLGRTFTGEWSYRRGDVGNHHRRRERDGAKGYMVTVYGTLPPEVDTDFVRERMAQVAATVEGSSDDG